MSKPSEWIGGKGDCSRISNFRKYQESPLWDNFGKSKKLNDQVVESPKEIDTDEEENPD